MENYFKNITKSALLMGCVGVALGFAVKVIAPPLVDTALLDSTIAGNSPAWLGGLFAAFGGLRAAFQPLIDKAFGDATVQESIVKERGIAKEKTPEIELENWPCHSNHATQIEASRSPNIRWR